MQLVFLDISLHVKPNIELNHYENEQHHQNNGLVSYPYKHYSAKNDVLSFFKSLDNLYVVILSHFTHLFKQRL